jgi:hypothetical protein
MASHCMPACVYRQGIADRLEHLCRYAGRPAIAESRVSLLPDGRVAYSLKKTWKDGTTHVVVGAGWWRAGVVWTARCIASTRDGELLLLSVVPLPLLLLRGLRLSGSPLP